LIDQFFCIPPINSTDRYGGRSLAERSLFRATHQFRPHRRGPTFDLFCASRNGNFRITREACDERRKRWKPGWFHWRKRGLTFSRSQRRFWETEFTGSDLNFAGWAKKLTGKPASRCSVASGTFWPPSREAFDAQLFDELLPGSTEGRFFDLVAVGRRPARRRGWRGKFAEGRSSELIGFSKGSSRHFFIS